MKNESKDKFRNLRKAVFWLCCSLSAFLIIHDCYKKKQFDKYKQTFKGETIGLTTKFKKKSRRRYLQYCFHVNGKIISLTGTLRNEDVLNKFYKVKYDLDNPVANYIVLDEELRPDSLTLVNAGFTKVKYYIYDGGRTSEYIEKSKWE